MPKKSVGGWGKSKLSNAEVSNNGNGASFSGTTDYLQKFDSTLKLSFEEANLENFHKALCEGLDSFERANLQLGRFVIKNNNSLDCVLSSELAIKQFQKLVDEITRYGRQVFGNPALTITLIKDDTVVPQVELKPFTKEGILDAMAQENPLILELIKEFKLQ